jgi:hypothetical protein
MKTHEVVSKTGTHRTTERYRCPPFFAARVSGGGNVEENACIVDLSLRGLSARTCCAFEVGERTEVELTKTYASPVKVHASVKWVRSEEHEGFTHLVGFSISKVHVIDWFKFMRLVARMKREVW